jgi:glycine/D-amino acid oxidase-like deaminating enzyme
VPPAATTPLWLDEPYLPHPPLDGDRRCAVCVVGGGIGGIAAAWHLAERGIRAVLLEARTVASGASGRNGGFFIAGPAPMYDEARRRWGHERARRVYAATLEGQRAMLHAARTAGAEEHFKVGGLLRLAVDAVEAEAVRAHHAALREDGFPGDLVEEADLPAAVRRPGRVGLLTPHDGTVHPVRWIRALARAVEARGAEVFEGTAVTVPPAPDGDGVRIETGRGTVRADHAVVAIDGALRTLVPAAAVRCRRLNMVATAPADPGRLPLPIYARDGREYAHQRPDGRVALGGFSDLDGEASWTAEEEPSPPVQARLDRYLREELGIDAPVTHRWAGLVGYADDPLPTCGPVPGTDGHVLALGGYNGTGHVQAFVAARIVAEIVATGKSRDGGLYARIGAPAPG